MNKQDSVLQTPVSRRGFLVGTVATGTGVMFGATMLDQITGMSASEALAAGNFSPTMWYDITPTGIVNVHITKAEIGQHVGTALAQSVAEELEANWDDVRITYVDTDDKYGWASYVTGGSWSVNWTFDSLSRAGAAGRIALTEAAAKQLGVPTSECQATNSHITHTPSGQSLSYAQLVTAGGIDRTFTDDDLKTIELKKFGEYNLVGQPLPAIDIPPKTNGTARYGIDMNLPGQAYATLVRSNIRYGSRAKSVDDSAAQNISGYIKTLVIDDPVKHQENYVIALGEDFFASRAAADNISVDWEPGPNAGVSTDDIRQHALDLVAQGDKGLLFFKDGDPAGAIAGATQTLEAEYETAMAIHCPIEPQNAVVEFIDGVCHVYTGNQLQMLARDTTAQALGVETSQVVIHNQLLGGAFGRRLNNDNIIPTALAARELGRPVKLIYSREEDMMYDFTRSVVYQKMAGGLNSDGQLVGTRQDVVSGWGTELLSPGFLADSADKKGKLDPYIVNTADHWYSIPNMEAYAYKNELAQNAAPPGNLRSVSPGTTMFAVESFIDEAAHKAGQDPVDYRMSMLDAKGKNAGSAPYSVGGAKRLASALQHAIARAGYGTKPLPENTAMGVACVPAQERNTPSWTACVAEVAVNPDNGDFKVNKLTIAIDVGTAVNPNGVLAQTEGATLVGLEPGGQRASDAD